MDHKLKNLVNMHRDFNTALSEEKWLAANAVGFAAGIYSLYRSQKKGRGLLHTVWNMAVAYNVIGSLVTVKEQIKEAETMYLDKHTEDLLKRGADEMGLDVEGMSGQDIRRAAEKLARHVIHGDEKGLGWPVDEVR